MMDEVRHDQRRKSRRRVFCVAAIWFVFAAIFILFVATTVTSETGAAPTLANATNKAEPTITCTHTSDNWPRCAWIAKSQLIQRPVPWQCTPWASGDLRSTAANQPVVQQGVVVRLFIGARVAPVAIATCNTTNANFIDVLWSTRCNTTSNSVGDAPKNDTMVLMYDADADASACRLLFVDGNVDVWTVCLSPGNAERRRRQRDFMHRLRVALAQREQWCLRAMLLQLETTGRPVYDAATGGVFPVPDDVDVAEALDFVGTATRRVFDLFDSSPSLFSSVFSGWTVAHPTSTTTGVPVEFLRIITSDNQTTCVPRYDDWTATTTNACFGVTSSD
jgi:hypothetical protein